VVAHTERLLVSDHPGCGAKVGFAEIFLMPQPPLLTRRGMRVAHEFPYCISKECNHETLGSVTHPDAHCRSQTEPASGGEVAGAGTYCQTNGRNGQTCTLVP
jgi:hypothetical protein